MAVIIQAYIRVGWIGDGITWDELRYRAGRDFKPTGLAQFPPGTANREVIDAIPTAPATQPPGQAVITNASSPGAGLTAVVEKRHKPRQIVAVRSKSPVPANVI